jgi:hypothetical protein
MSEIRHHIVEGRSIMLWLPDMDKPKRLNASTIRANHPRFKDIVAATRRGDVEAVRNMVDVKAVITKLTVGRVEIRGDGVYFDGNRQGGLIADRIITLAQHGADKVSYLMRFMERLSKSPHYHVKNGDLFRFIEACTLPLTKDGCFVAYKFIRSDWMDCYSGTLDNSVGSIVEMPRNEVCDDRTQTCMPGLHVCSRGYLGGSYNKRLIAVKVAPEDVVCVPVEYGNSKLRVCRYEVLQELEDWNIDALPEHIFVDQIPAEPVAEAEPTYETNTVPLAEPDEPVITNIPTVEEVETNTQQGDYSQKMTEKKVRQFKRLLRQVEQGTMSLTALCKQFGISRRNGARIRDGEIWAHVK